MRNGPGSSRFDPTRCSLRWKALPPRAAASRDDEPPLLRCFFAVDWSQAMSNDAEPRPKPEGNLAFDTSGAIDRMVQQDLERIRAESLLALQDSAQELTRALDASLAEPLALCDAQGRAGQAGGSGSAVVLGARSPDE